MAEHFEVRDGLVYLWIGETDAVVMQPRKALQVGRQCVQAALDAMKSADQKVLTVGSEGGEPEWV